MKLDNTAAIVTGGASGLGAATAPPSPSRARRSSPSTSPPPSRTRRAVDGVEYVAVDVTDEEQVRAGVAQAAGAGVPLRTVVNCAGIGPSMRILGKKGVHDLAFYAKVVQVNLVGTVQRDRGRLRGDRRRPRPTSDGQRGVIVNTACIAAYDGQVGQAAYASSKGGIVGLTLPAARDLAQYGIRVCTIAPGIVETPMLATVLGRVPRRASPRGCPFPQRLGRPEEYAQLALAIIEHDYLNGEVIRMDGALRMAPR